MSEKVMQRLHNLAPLVEQVSIDEAFVDISDMFAPASSAAATPERIARKLQSEICTELGLPCSIGIASTKLVAKIATEVGKKSGKQGEPPNAITIVPAGEEAAFLDPLPADMLWGVGPKTAAKLAELGIHTIGDIARWPEDDLIRRFGENGREMSRHALGLDN